MKIIVISPKYETGVLSESTWTPGQITGFLGVQQDFSPEESTGIRRSPAGVRVVYGPQNSQPRSGIQSESSGTPQDLD
jgi:hypothetical protein